MKRKTIFKFALLGATALTLVACAEAEEDVLAYDSVEACVKGGQQDEAVCRAEFAKAQKLHNEVAPRYGNSRDCYSDFGYNRCNQYRPYGGSSVWLPFMMGYMLAPRGRTAIVSTQPLSRVSKPNRLNLRRPQRPCRSWRTRNLKRKPRVCLHWMKKKR